MRISETKAAAEVLSMVEDEALVAWIPDDSHEIVYGQLLPLDAADDDPPLERVRVRLASNRGFTLAFPIGTAIYKLQHEQFWRYSWNEMKPVRLG